ncbi:MAG: ASCH domain-containing protein [Ktedonobacteraceae bacterium]
MSTNSMRELHMRSNLFSQVVGGQKTLIVRVGDGTVQGIQPSEVIRLRAHNRSQDIRVSGIRLYHNFEEMLENEDASKILPGANKHQTLALMRTMYPQDQEQLGVFVLEVELVK